MNIFSQLLDIIYPPRCHICEDFLLEDGDRGDRQALQFCRTCLDDFAGITSPLCTLCGRPFEMKEGEDHRCEACLRRTPFYDKLGAPYLYQGTLMEAIHRFKYGGRTSLAGALGSLMIPWAQKWLSHHDAALMMPIPLHPRRLRERGFNQSLLLARFLAARLEIEVDYLTLRRIRYTQPQTGLDTKQRRSNVRRAFQLAGPEVVKGETIILVDDVVTTGNTMNECARVLKRAGVERVIGLALARTAGY